MRHAAPLLKHLEHGQDIPAAFVDFQTLAGLQDPGDILVKAAAGDVANAVDVALGYYLEHLLYIYLCGGKEHFSELAAAKFRYGILV